VGINYEQSRGTSAEIQEELTAGLELGLYFEYLDMYAWVDAELEKTLKRDVQSTYAVDYGIENETTCTTEGKDGAGLYQWIVSTADFRSQAFTWHTVCRTGDNWNKAPECPYNACLDPECNECA